MKRGGPHRARPVLAARHPVHVSLRCVRGVPRLRQACMYHAIRRVLARYVEAGAFRVVHISIQVNHLHLIIEAIDKASLTWGMQSFAINAARAINRAWGREGKVFAHRYHAKQIKDPQYARNAIAYVLNNWRRHREDYYDGDARRAKLDRYSSAIAFDGWTERFGRPPRTRMLDYAWRMFGRIDPHEIPGTM